VALPRTKVVTAASDDLRILHVPLAGSNVAAAGESHRPLAARRIVDGEVGLAVAVIVAQHGYLAVSAERIRRRRAVGQTPPPLARRGIVERESLLPWRSKSTLRLRRTTLKLTRGATAPSTTWTRSPVSPKTQLRHSSPSYNCRR
jgi:hypothetical protein